MIELTKINGEQIIVNSRLIEYIVTIPETKLIMTNGKYYIVKEPANEIIEKVVSFEHRVIGGSLTYHERPTGKSGIIDFEAGNLEEEGK